MIRAMRELCEAMCKGLLPSFTAEYVKSLGFGQGSFLQFSVGRPPVGHRGRRPLSAVRYGFAGVWRQIRPGSARAVEDASPYEFSF